jgi:hypothetical protein
MTQAVLQSLQFYIEQTGRAARVAAQNCHLNGYHVVALKHENEAALAESLLRDLANEGEVNAG